MSHCAAQMHRVGMRFLVDRQDERRKYGVEFLLHKALMGPGKNMFSSVVKKGSTTSQGFLGHLLIDWGSCQSPPVLPHFNILTVGKRGQT